MLRARTGTGGTSPGHDRRIAQRMTSESMLSAMEAMVLPLADRHWCLWRRDSAINEGGMCAFRALSSIEKSPMVQPRSTLPFLFGARGDSCIKLIFVVAHRAVANLHRAGECFVEVAALGVLPLVKAWAQKIVTNDGFLGVRQLCIGLVKWRCGRRRLRY